MSGPATPDDDDPDATVRGRVTALHAAGMGRNQIARELGLSTATVSRIAAAEHLKFDRAATAAALEARQIDLKARRVELKGLLLEDAHKLRKQLWEPARLVAFGGKDNTINEVTLAEPQFVDKKNIMAAVGIAIDRFEKLDARDSGNDTDSARSLLSELGRALGISSNDDTLGV
jgi:hypothetical protein